MYERFTDRARKVMQLADGEAQKFNHKYVGTEHILLGLIKEGRGVAGNVLNNLGISLDYARQQVERLVTSSPASVIDADPSGADKKPLTQRALKAVEYAAEEADALRHNYVGTEHVLLGLVREGQGIAAQVMINAGVTLDGVRAAVIDLLGIPPGKDASGPATTSTTQRVAGWKVMTLNIPDGQPTDLVTRLRALVAKHDAELAAEVRALLKSQ